MIYGSTNIRCENETKALRSFVLLILAVRLFDKRHSRRWKQNNS